MMIMQPDWITKQMIKEAIEITRKNKPELSELLKKLCIEPYNEGNSAQIMHLGPFSEEGHTIDKLHKFIGEFGGKFDDLTHKHHEIYLSDPRRAKPENMKTVIRQPFTL